MLDIFLQGLTAPFDYFIEPGRRLYWLFLVSSLVLASLVITFSQQRFDLRIQLRSLLNQHYWFNSSTVVDFGLLFLNSIVRVLLLVPLLGSHLSATIIVGSLLQDNLGDAPSLALPLVIIGGLYTVIFFLLEDFSRFGLHLAMHKWRWLWHFHRVHHAATTLTPFTVHRVHPVEMTLYYLRGVVVFGLVSGIFVYLFRDDIHGWAILGVDSLGFLFNFIGANLRHSPIRLSFGPFEKWLISPAQHQIHHSAAFEHRDKNMGTCLALWDRLLGSWVAGSHARQVVFGLAV